MKKVLVALASVLLILVLVTVGACSYVPSTSFLSNAKRNSLVETYGTPQAVVTLKYKRSDNGENKEREIKITYDLLLSQTPIAVIRFIQLAEAGVYNDTVIDKNDSTYHYMVMGRYAAVKNSEDGDDYTYFNRTSDVTFAGEFSSNGYKEPNEGYAQFGIFSLAMFHEQTTDDSSFNEANGTLILALSSQTLNPNNYAVFAAMKSVSYRVDDGEWKNYTDGRVPSNVVSDLESFTSRTSSIKVYDDETKTSYTSPSITNNKVFLHVEIVGANGKSADWSKLPRIGK